MKVIIPVAGAGNRLKPHTNSLPKPLIEVAGRTILDHVLHPILDLAPEEVIFVIGHKGELIKDHIDRQKNIKATYVQQNELSGLGFAVYLALQNMEDSPLLIVLGDTIVDCDIKKFVSCSKNVLGLKEVDDPGRFGIAEITDNLITGVEEKPENPKTNLALIGLYYFNNSSELNDGLEKIVKENKRTSGEIQLTDAISAMIHAGSQFTGFVVEGWYDCGKKETLLETNRILIKDEQPRNLTGCKINSPVYIAGDVNISDSEIGPYVSISKGATIRNSKISDSIIGADAKVVNSSLKASIIGPSAKIDGARGILNVGDSA